MSAIKLSKVKYIWKGSSEQTLDIPFLEIKKGQKNSNNLKKGNIIYWKGHVAVCINSKKLIHAYGPRKKVLIMNIKNTIKIIEKTANLKVKKITKI